MFTDKDQNFVKVELDATLYLGRKHIGEEFFDLLLRLRKSICRKDGIRKIERGCTVLLIGRAY